MSDIHKRIELLERGLEKHRKELRGYRFPSQKYIHCEETIKNIEEALKHLYEIRIIQRANLQIRLFNHEEYNEQYR